MSDIQQAFLIPTHQDRLRRPTIHLPPQHNCPNRWIELDCGCHAWLPQVSSEYVQKRVEIGQLTPETDFKFVLKCFSCDQELTKPISWLDCEEYHTWPLWLWQNSRIESSRMIRQINQ